MPTPSNPLPRRRARVWRILGRLALSVVALIVVTAGSVYAWTEHLLVRRYSIPEHVLSVPSTPEAIARGQHLATIRGCVDCHGADFGGAMIIDDPAIGRIGGANLTEGRVGGRLTDQDWERAVRHGLRRDGTSLLVMPSEEFAGLTDEDLSAIAAYVRSLPAVHRAKLPVQLGPVLRALATAGQVQLAADVIEHNRPHRTTITVEPTALYGGYLAEGCTGCHGTGFSGGKIPGAPPDWKPAANITPAGIGRYNAEDFTRILRTGKRPDGSAVDSLMPWRLTKSMTDTEITALYAYLRTVPSKAYGNR